MCGDRLFCTKERSRVYNVPASRVRGVSSRKAVLEVTKLTDLIYMAKIFFCFLMAVIALIVTVGLAWYGRSTTIPPVVVTQSSLQSDSLVRSLFYLIASTSKEVRRDSFIRMERYVERTTVNENGDILRHDTRTEITTEQYQALEKENKTLQMRIDSLERVKNRVDTVPVPYEVDCQFRWRGGCQLGSAQGSTRGGGLP